MIVQHIGMAHSVCEYGKSRLLFERASNILGYDLLDKVIDLLFGLDLAFTRSCH